jgi:predicted HAD superfamily Cof-like phosphohydrolase
MDLPRNIPGDEVVIRMMPPPLQWWNEDLKSWEIQNISWRELKGSDLDAALGMLIVRAILDGSRPNLNSLTAYLGISADTLFRPFRNLVRNGILVRNKLRNDMDLLNANESDHIFQRRIAMNNEQKMVKEFHIRHGCCNNDKPTLLDAGTLLTRGRLIVEESAEFLKAASNSDMVEMVDALCDILYVTYGTAVGLGVDLEPVFAEVQRSNMTKGDGGQDLAGKVRKGPSFSPPDIVSELQKQGQKD